MLREERGARWTSCLWSTTQPHCLQRKIGAANPRCRRSRSDELITEQKSGRSLTDFNWRTKLATARAFELFCCRRLVGCRTAALACCDVETTRRNGVARCRSGENHYDDAGEKSEHAFAYHGDVRRIPEKRVGAQDASLCEGLSSDLEGDLNRVASVAATDDLDRYTVERNRLACLQRSLTVRNPDWPASRT